LDAGDASQDASDDDDGSTRNLYNLPQTVLSYGTVESLIMRRYVLEDILQCEVVDRLLLLISPHHMNYESYWYIASLVPPFPIGNHRAAEQKPSDVLLVSDMIGGVLTGDGADGADGGNIAQDILGTEPNDGNALANEGVNVDEQQPEDVLGEVIGEVSIGKTKKKLHNVRRVPVNPLALRDIFVQGRVILEKDD
jgi:hypothetical protein